MTPREWTMVIPAFIIVILFLVIMIPRTFFEFLWRCLETTVQCLEGWTYRCRWSDMKNNIKLVWKRDWDL